MPIPDFQSLMRPYLNAISTEVTFKTGDVVEKLANELGLSELERQELLPSGKQARFDNRVGWTRTHLAKAGLITSPARGVITITSRGLEALKSDEPIDMAYLSRYPEYLRFRTGAQSYKASQLASPSKIASEDSEKTPQEVISDNISYLEQTLADELLAKIMESSPKFFEQLVVDLLLAMGYGGSRKEAGQAIGKANDGGIDGIINEDRLGLDTIYIQAKRWTNPVDAKTVREFGGALMGQGASKGVLITPSTFTTQAANFATGLKQVKLILIDGSQLARLMIQHNVGVTETETYVIKRLDLDYFEAD